MPGPGAGPGSAGPGGPEPDDQDNAVAGDLAGAGEPAENVAQRLWATAQAFRSRAQAGVAARSRPGLPLPEPPPAEHPPAPRPEGEPQVPRLLQRWAAWAWRLLLVGLLIYVTFRVASALRLVVLPCIAALLLTALLQPLTARLRRRGMPALAATWCTVLATIIVVGGLVTLAVDQVSADYPTLVTEVTRTAHEVQSSLAGPPFRLSSVRLQQLTNQLLHFLSQHQSQVAGTVLTGSRIFVEVLAGLVLMIFVTFFLLKDGERIWLWLIKGMPLETRRRADNAGAAAWAALVNYVRGTTLVAIIHAVFIGLALWALGVPLLVPLVILVFLAAYIPLVGILIAGALAILVTLGTKGLLAAVILLAVFLLENQIESHLLQPLIVGRIVRLHPLAVILVLAVGGVTAGIAGAIVAVPASAALSYAWPYLRGRPVAPPPGAHGIGDPEPPGPGGTGSGGPGTEPLAPVKPRPEHLAAGEAPAGRG
jgi:predicted PurR-regulated permease PerM